MTTTPNEIVLEGFDVDTYASKYSGRNKIDRLLFVAEGSPCVRKHALSTLLRVLKDSINMSLYSQIAEKLSAISPESVTLDRMHMEQVKRSCMQRQERLEQELNSYKSSMIKESIRMGHNDLGDFYYEMGDLALALKSFAQARDYCTTDKHIIDMCFNVIKVAIHMSNFVHVSNYLLRLEQVASTSSDVILKSKISATFGLLALHDKKYYQAASKFVNCQIDIGNTYSDVLHAEDIALYGGICALACYNREELREKVINQTSFKAFLELVPWLRELINDFYSSRYAMCLETLDKMKQELCLDMYLASHVDVLCKEIRSRAMIQYFYPYLSVDLHQMAQAFLTDPLVLEKEICDLISTGKIDARLDSFQKVLYSHQSNKRQVTYKHALEVGRNHVAESRNLLLRMSLIKNNVIVRQVK